MREGSFKVVGGTKYKVKYNSQQIKLITIDGVLYRFFKGLQNDCKIKMTDLVSEQ